MKSIFIILGVVIVVAGVWYTIATKPDKSIQNAKVTDNVEEKKVVESDNKPVISKEVDNANVKIAFKGFGPGKVHNGSFSKIDSKLSFNGADLQGEVTVDMSSLVTDTEQVTAHLKTNAFFDVAKYPTATIKINSLQDGTLSGFMTIHGISKNVSFDVVSSATELSAKFNIDMKEFGINQTFANEVVEVDVTVPVK